MSLCDTCAEPGKCCRYFNLQGGNFGRGETAIEVLARLATIVTDPDSAHITETGQIGLPFLPLFRRQDGIWLLWCPRLTREGRCGDYEHRPGLCKDYQPLDDWLCHYWKPQADGCDGCTPFADRASTAVKATETEETVNA